MSMSSSLRVKTETGNLDLAILSEIFGRVPYGRVILALYDPDSQFNPLMVNVAASHLKSGRDLLYLSSSRPTGEIRQQFNDLGVNVAEYEAKDNAVLFDDYSTQMGMKSPEKYHSTSTNLNERSIVIGQSAPQWPPGTLVIIESFSSMAINEENVFAKFARKATGVWRARGTVMIIGLATDIQTSQFYHEMKLLCDGVFEVRLIEHHAEMIDTIRSRSMKGQRSDTRWRQILFDNKMRASLQFLK